MGYSGAEVFVFTSDLEYALITDKNKAEVAQMLTDLKITNADYKGYDLAALRRQIGSKGIPLNAMDKPPLKKPFIHRKIAQTIDLRNCSPDITRLMKAIDDLV